MKNMNLQNVTVAMACHDMLYFEMSCKINIPQMS